VSDLLAERLAESEHWRAMDSAELARQYSPRGTVPDVDRLLRDYRSQSTPMYALPHLHDVAYGPHPDERLDLFPVPGRPDAPLFVFVHGGYWRALAKEDSVFMAKNFTERGIAVAAINYQLAPQARLEDIVAQCRRALAWLYLNGAAQGVGVDRIVLAGSSAGAHLAAMLLAPGWQSGLGLPEDVVKAAALVSGLYDLAPVQQTQPNAWLNLDAQQALALSPMQALPPASTRLLVATAALDTDEFKRQSLLYAAACQQRGCAVQYLEVPQRNHFDVILDWMDSEAPLTRHTWPLFEPDGPTTSRQV
jgi:arylformamidase